MDTPHPYNPPHPLRRRTVIVGTVVGLHVAGLWALQSGLMRTAPPTEVVVPATLLSQVVAAPSPAPAPVPAPAPTSQPTPTPVQRQARPSPAPRPAPAMPQAIAQDEPAPNAPSGSTTAPATASEANAPAVAAAPPAPPAPPAPAAAPRIELPSSNAAYLNNPKPSYPSISKRMGEQGQVVVRVLIDVQGQPQKVELHKSSGFDRLDRQAIEAVQQWRFVPGKRNGVPEAMSHLVPVNFVLE